MLSESELMGSLRTLLGRHAEKTRPTQLREATERINRLEDQHGIRVSPYGLVRWAIDRYGYRAGDSSMAVSRQVIDGYVEEAVKLRDDMPCMVLNANEYLERLASNMGDMETVLGHLERMSMPYILYVLFAGAGMPEYAERYRQDAAEHLRRYPSTLDLLPEPFRSLEA